MKRRDRLKEVLELYLRLESIRLLTLEGEETEEAEQKFQDWLNEEI